MSATDSSIGEMLRETATRLFQEHIEPRVLREAEQGAWPAAAWAALEDAGLHRGLVPESAGGYGVPVADALSLLRVAGEHAVPLPLAETMLASWLLALAGLPIPDGPLSVAPVGPADGLSLDAAGRLSGTASRVPWGGQVEAVAVLVEQAGRSLVALVPRAAYEVTAGTNVAGEPRDTLHFDVVPTEVAAIALSRAELRAVGAVEGGAKAIEPVAGRQRWLGDRVIC